MHASSETVSGRDEAHAGGEHAVLCVNAVGGNGRVGGEAPSVGVLGIDAGHARGIERLDVEEREGLRPIQNINTHTRTHKIRAQSTQTNRDTEASSKASGERQPLPIIRESGAPCQRPAQTAGDRGGAPCVRAPLQ